MISELDIAKMPENTAIYSVFMLWVVLGGGVTIYIYISVYMYRAAIKQNKGHGSSLKGPFSGSFRYKACCLFGHRLP